MNAREKAKELLRHYFGMVSQKQGLKWDSDNDTEINAIVDCIIDAAVDEVRYEVSRRFRVNDGDLSGV